MRTKALLLGAVISAIGLATSMAQVYSVNIVGYINLVIEPGTQMLANQLDAPQEPGKVKNAISSVFKTFPAYTTVYKWNGTGYNPFVYDPEDVGWLGSGPDNTSIAPGEGCFLAYTGSESFTNTLVGEVVLNSSVALSGITIFSSAVPEEKPLNLIGYPAADLGYHTLYRWNGSGYTPFVYDPEDVGWLGAAAPDGPTMRIGEAMFIATTGGSANWNRNFTVGP